MISTYFLIYFFIIFQFNSNIVLSQRDFANPAVSDPAPCACNIQVGVCDANCCCDSDCSDADLKVSPICNSIRTNSSYLSSQEENLATWNCSNSTSAALYDYFPFVCVQLKLNEIIGEFYSTDNVTFITTGTSVDSLRSSFTTEYPELFQSTTITTTTSTNLVYSMGVPVQQNASILFALPGILVGSVCQNNINVLFGVNSDVVCAVPTDSLCNTINSVTSLQSGGGGSTSNVSVTFSVGPFTNSSSPTTIISTTEYYFKASYNLNINNINNSQFVNGSINDYCPNRHPLARTQRYFSACASTSGCNSSGFGYQTYSGCTLRDNFAYSLIPSNFFNARSSSTDDSTGFSDFNNATSTPSVTCSTGINNIQRVLYRINYSSTNNTISTVQVFVLTQSPVTQSRITIQWNDIASNPATNTTIPRGYLTGEVLQFRQNNNFSDVSSLVPISDGSCVNANAQTLRYKQSTSSQCFIQLNPSTIQNCHNLKLNMYIYLNVFYAPATHVLAYPSANATQIQIRNDTQDSIDLDRIDETRLNNRLNISTIFGTQLFVSTPTIYDIVQNVPMCFDVPSGIYIEFGFVRVSISPNISFERIVSVRYNYTYSTWQFDCTTASCSSTATQKYLITFQSAFVDYTDAAFNLPDLTKSDIASADNYIQDLLWLITPEYKGEPGYRNYTIAMILIFIAISSVVIHILLFGVMCPF